MRLKGPNKHQEVPLQMYLFYFSQNRWKYFAALQKLRKEQLHGLFPHLLNGYQQIQQTASPFATSAILR